MHHHDSQWIHCVSHSDNMIHIDISLVAILNGKHEGICSRCMRSLPCAWCFQPCLNNEMHEVFESFTCALQHGNACFVFLRSLFEMSNVIVTYIAYNRRDSDSC